MHGLLQGRLPHARGQQRRARPGHRARWTAPRPGAAGHHDAGDGRLRSLRAPQGGPGAPRDMPVIFLTAKTEVDDEQKGFDARRGRLHHQADLPADRDGARARPSSRSRRAARFPEGPERVPRERGAPGARAKCSVVQDVTIMAMASLAETRDNETGNHIRRTQQLRARAGASNCSAHPKFCRAHSTTPCIDMLYKSAPLHDIGKVGIPDAHPAQAGQAHARGIRDHEDPHHPRARRDRRRPKS